MADGDLNYYEVLGLSPSAGVDEIRAAHRRLVKQGHPDRGGKAEMFLLLQRAYETLIDPEKRAAYDHDLGQGTTGGNAVDGFDFSKLVGEPAGATVEYLQSVGIHPTIRLAAVQDPRLDGRIIEVDPSSPTLTVGVTQPTAMWFVSLGFFALQTAWNLTKRGAVVAKRAADTGLKELEAARTAGPGYEIPRPWQARGCMTSIYVVYAAVAVLVVVIGAIPAGAKILLLVLAAILLSPFAIAIAIHRGARRSFYRQGK